MRRVPEGNVNRIIEKLKEVYVPDFRDRVLFGFNGMLWWYCYDPDSVRPINEGLISWGKSNYSDEDVRKDWDTVNRVWGGGDIRRWGRPSFYNVLVDFYRSRGYDENEAKAAANIFLSELFQLIGYRARRRVSVVISKGGKIAGRGSTAYITNDPRWGIVVLYRRVREGRVLYDYDAVLLYWYIDRARIIEDPYSGNMYYDVTFRNVKAGSVRRIKYLTFPELIDYVIQRLGPQDKRINVATYLNTLLVAMADNRRHPIITGVAYDGRDGVPRIVAYGAYRSNMRELLNARGDPRVFLDLVVNWFNNDPKVWDAFAVGLFQAFNYLRKHAGAAGISRNKLLVLVGEPNTGKSTIARIITGIIFNHPDLAKGDASILKSESRLGKHVKDSTIPTVVNDVREASFDNVAESLKTLATEDGPVHQVSVPYGGVIKYWGFGGLIITANKVHINDAGLEDRLYRIYFTANDDRTIDKKRVHDFEEWLNKPEVRGGLIAFGRLYISTLIEDWGKVRDIVLQFDYVKAAREYLAYVVSKIGGKANFNYIDEEVIERSRLRHTYALAKAIMGIFKYKPITGNVLDAFIGMVENHQIDAKLIPGDGNNVEAIRLRKGFIDEYMRGDVDGVKSLYDGLRKELEGAIPCLSKHLIHDKDQRGVYLQISTELLSYILGITDRIQCQ